VEQWKKTVLTELGEDNRPFVIAHPDSEWTQIPARDGTAHGGIKRSNKFPNCSYFYNWTSLDDKITWLVEVGASGNYEVIMHYALPKGDEGTAVQITYGMGNYASATTVTLSKAHDVPVRGQENDRVKRMESYVKDFKPISMGMLKLKQGKGLLTLEALEIPGETALEFRLLMLKRVK